MFRAGLSLVVLLLPACKVDNEVTTKREKYDDVPVMVVDPGFLDFGGLGTGQSALHSFTIRNDGGIPLDITEVRVEGATGFTLLTTATGTIQPQESLTVDVMYQPTNLTDTATIRIFGDDPQNPEDQVDLTGQWLLPVLAIEPDPYEFGAVPFGCLTGKTLTLSNIGSDTLVIDSIIGMGEDQGYRLPALPQLPLEIEPGGSVPLQLLYEASSEALQTSQVWVTSNDPSGAKVATQTGWGVVGDCVEVDVPANETIALDLSFTVEAGLADVAFALDTTSSMSGLALAMASEFRNIVGDLDSLFSDATYGVATYDDYAESPYGSRGTDLPFILRQQQTEDIGAVQRALSTEVAIHYGDDTPESTMEALYQGLTGIGFDQNCNGTYNVDTDVKPFVASATDLFEGTGGEANDASTLGGGTIGGFGFRENMLPIIVYATDAPLRDADDTSEFSTPSGACHVAGHTDVVNAANALNAKLIGVGVNVMSYESTFTQMQNLATETGSYADLDGDGIPEPAVVTWSGTSAEFRENVVGAVEQLVAAMNYEKIELVASDDTVGFVTDIAPEAFYDVSSGETVTFTVTLEGVLPAQEYEQANQLTFFLIGDETTLLHTYTVTVITPTN
ncbi:MAG: choice-of-anchor D domain-containing protein [Pseudomonadota bacterium]|nr:choice-of-anchor D domain-containing protein [Pseudomonadota bacterium]